jgi:nitroreductase
MQSIASPEDVDRFFSAHVSVREYTGEALRPGDWERLVRAARRAPTDAGAQWYSLVRVTEASLRQRCAEWCGDQRHIVTASEFVVGCADVERIRRLLEHRGLTYGMGPRVAIHFGIVDATLALHNLATAAELLGYRYCYIGGVLNGLDEITRALRLPPGVFPVAGLTVGVPGATPAARPRLPERLVIHENAYRRAEAADLDEAFQAMAPATRGGDWLPALERYFAPGGRMALREPVLQSVLARQVPGFEPSP